jgi:outer membrane receptor protein involved in Fe transport
MVYARLASGYRPGGPNTNSTPNPVPNYKRDTTQNYEIGVKGSALDHALNFDASLYYIDWKDIQLQVFNGTSIYVNGSRAKSQGVEFSVESRPRRGLTLAAWAAWNDAVLTQDFPNTGTANAVGSSGDRLPNSSRFSGALSLDQEFPLTGAMTGFVGATLSYFGDRRDVFTSIFAASPERQYLPAYARTDLRGGARYETWTLNLFVNNATDRRGVVTGGIGATNPIAFTYIQPRTAGLSFSKAF